MLNDLGFLRNNNLDWAFLKMTFEFDFQSSLQSTCTPRYLYEGTISTDCPLIRIGAVSVFFLSCQH